MNRKAFYGKIWNKLIIFNRKNKLIKPTNKVLVGVSGGSDSVCLLDFLVKFSKKIPFDIIACYINHGLRGKASQKDEEFVKKLCRKSEVKCVTKKVKTAEFAKKNRLTIEHAARTLRYRAFAYFAGKYKCGLIATGHQSDDNAETVLLNILRGTNPRGLAGILPRRKLNPKSNIWVIRPLLCLTRKEVLEYIKQNKLTYRTDTTNKSLKFTRNWIRHKLIPMLETKQPCFKNHLLKIADANRSQ